MSIAGPYLMVADLHRPNPEPFAVIAVYPENRMGKGCEGRVVSLHMTRDEAERVVASGSMSETQQ